MKKHEKKVTSLKSQSAWLLFAKITGFAFAFVLPLLVVRFLSREQVGVYQQSFLVLTNAVAILPLGLAMSAFYFLAREESQRASAVLNILLFNFFAGAIACFVLFFFPQILGYIFRSDEMQSLAPLIGVAVWLWLFSMFLETVVVANQESRLATVFIILAQFSKTALMIVAVIVFSTVESIIYAAIVQGALQTVILLFYLNKRFPRFWRKFDFGFLREHLVYALPFGFAGILWTLQTDIHYYFVGYRYSDAELAIYRIGCFQLPLVTILAESVTSVLIPKMSQLQLEDDKREMIRITARAMQKLAFFFFPTYVFLMITSHTFIKTLFTRNYLESEMIFVVFLTLLPFHILISDPIVRAYKELGRFLLFLRIATSVVLIAALFYGIQRFSLPGMIAIVVFVRIAEMLIAEFVTFRKIGVRKSDLLLLTGVGKTAIVSICAGVATFLVYYFINESGQTFGRGIAEVLFSEPKINLVDFISGMLILGISVIVYSLVYLFLSNLWGIIDDDEKQQFRRVANKVRLLFAT